LIQSTHKDFAPDGGHGVLICRRHWLIQELVFAVDLFIHINCACLFQVLPHLQWVLQ